MSNGYQKLMIGFLLVILDLNIQTLDILPDFIGYSLVLSGLGILYAQSDVEFFKVARIWAYVLTATSFFSIFTEQLQVLYLGSFPLYMMTVISQSASLFLIIYLYMGMAQEMRKIGKIGLAHKFTIENWVFAGIQGCILVLGIFSLNIVIEVLGLLSLGLIIVALILYVRLILNLNKCKKLALEMENPSHNREEELDH